jgi:hypothetical protein
MSQVLSITRVAEHVPCCYCLQKEKLLEQQLPGRLDHICFHPTDPGTFSTLSAGQLSLWSAQGHAGTSAFRQQPVDLQGAAVNSIGWTADGIFCCCSDGRLLLVQATEAGLHAQLLLEGQQASAVAASAGLLAVGGPGASVAVYGVAQQGSTWQVEALASFQVPGQAVTALAWGIGNSAAQLLVNTSGGGLWLATLDAGGDGAEAVELQPVLQQHSGTVTGATAVRPGCVATCGSDGTLRVWELASGSQTESMQTAGRLSSVAATPGPSGWVAAGSETGVVRLLAKQGEELKLVGRCRLGGGAVTQLAFSPASTLLAAACGPRQLWLAAAKSAPNSSESSSEVALAPLGFIAVPADIAAVSWLPTSGPTGRDSALVALSNGSLLHITAPAGAKQAAAADLQLSDSEAPVVPAKLEAPLVAMAVQQAAGGKPLLYGLAAGKVVVKYQLPGDAAGWQGAARTALKPSARVSHMLAVMVTC